MSTAQKRLCFSSPLMNFVLLECRVAAKSQETKHFLRTISFNPFVNHYRPSPFQEYFSHTSTLRFWLLLGRRYAQLATQFDGYLNFIFFLFLWYQETKGNGLSKPAFSEFETYSLSS